MEAHQSALQAVPDAIIPAFLLATQCSWCLAEAGQEQGKGSHGICEKHAIIVWERWQEEKRLREQMH